MPRLKPKVMMVRKKPDRRIKKLFLDVIDISVQPEDLLVEYKDVDPLINKVETLYSTGGSYIRAQIEEVVNKYSDKYTSFDFHLKIIKSDHYRDSSDFCCICDAFHCTCTTKNMVEIHGLRPETDKEYNYRIDRTKKAEDKKKKAASEKEKKDLKEYERLKEKYKDLT